MRDMSGVFAVRWKMRLFVVLALIAASQGELVESRYIILTAASPEVCITTEYIIIIIMSVIFAVSARRYLPAYIMIDGKWLHYNIYPSYNNTQI